MNIDDLLATDRIICQSSTTSKKKALEILSESLANHLGNRTPTEIFDALIARERLGSTGLGHGVAIPHSRMTGIDTTLAAILKLDQGVDYDSPDRQPVDFMFALIVPEEATEAHLQLLARLAELFSDQQFMQIIRSETDPQGLRLNLSQRITHRAA